MSALNDPLADESLDQAVEGLLARLDGGDREALGDLMRIVQEELRTLARSSRRRWSQAPSLQTTEVISEAYLRLFGKRTPAIKDRRHFFCLVARTMRCVLIDRYRSARPFKQQMPRVDVDPDEVVGRPPSDAAEWTEIAEALQPLANADPELCRLVELRVFLGLKWAEIGQILEMPERTLHNHWDHARRWLRREVDRARQRGATDG